MPMLPFSLKPKMVKKGFQLKNLTTVHWNCSRGIKVWVNPGLMRHK
jgi:hypothetical protein